MTTTEENKVLFRRTYEQLLNMGDLSVADELVSAEFINHEAPPGRDRGPESLRGLAAMLRTAFPNLHFKIEELVAEGETVAGRLTRGADEGPLMGTPPTGRSVRQEHMHFVRSRDREGVQHWGVRDDLGMMRQLALSQSRDRKRNLPLRSFYSPSAWKGYPNRRTPFGRSSKTSPSTHLGEQASRREFGPQRDAKSYSLDCGAERSLLLFGYWPSALARRPTL